MKPDLDSLSRRIRDDGFGFVPSAAVAALLDAPLADWDTFAASWNDMPLDTYMADGGRYRRRRHATLSVAPFATQATLEAHQPHYQSRDYNRLNGGIARHYEPVAPTILRGETMTALIGLGSAVFGHLSPGVHWHVEVHQFRIEANAAASGRPTPEGVHRDGVDYVMVMMVKRHNIAEGTTTIHRPDGTPLASFTLTEPMDLTLVDDHRCLHGVTPVVAQDVSRPAYRDVLVVTFRERSSGG
ncbi:MAG: 2OG-Fe dioxygenase family protein [Betaproteobacteria bacterium]